MSLQKRIDKGRRTFGSDDVLTAAYNDLHSKAHSIISEESCEMQRVNEISRKRLSQPVFATGCDATSKAKVGLSQDFLVSGCRTAASLGDSQMGVMSQGFVKNDCRIPDVETCKPFMSGLKRFAYHSAQESENVDPPASSCIKGSSHNGNSANDPTCTVSKWDSMFFDEENMEDKKNVCASFQIDFCDNSDDDDSERTFGARPLSEEKVSILCSETSDRNEKTPNSPPCVKHASEGSEAIKYSPEQSCIEYSKGITSDNEGLGLLSTSLSSTTKCLSKDVCSTPAVTKDGAMSDLHSSSSSPINVPYSKNSDLSLASFSGSSSTKARKRKFPGPAGILPDIPPGTNLSALKQLEFSSMNVSSDSVYEKEIVCSQETVEHFHTVPWQQMLKDFSSHADPSLIKRFNIRTALWKASKKRLPKHVILPFLCTFLENVTLNSIEAEALFRDETGSIPGKITIDAVEKHRDFITANSAIVLKKAEFLCNQLIVRPSNIAAIYTRSGKNIPLQDLCFEDDIQNMAVCNQSSSSFKKEELRQKTNSTSESASAQKAMSNTVNGNENYDSLLKDDMDDLLTIIDDDSFFDS